MFSTPNIRVLYSYLVVLGHCSRVILCFILALVQYFRGLLTVSVATQLFLRVLWGSSMNKDVMKYILYYTMTQWGSRVYKTNYDIVLVLEGGNWDIFESLWRYLQSLPKWCKSTYMFVSIQYSFGYTMSSEVMWSCRVSLSILYGTLWYSLTLLCLVLSL